MTKQDLIRKLSSRKFWAFFVGFVSSLLLAFNLGENQIAQITSVITAFGSVVIYVFAESSVDKARIETEKKEIKVIETTTEQK